MTDASSTASLRAMQAEARRGEVTLVLAGMTTSGVLLMFMVEWMRWPRGLDYLALGLMLLPLGAWWLLGRWRLPALWLVALGGIGAPALALHWAPYGMILALLALPTGVAALLIGDSAGSLTACLASTVILVAGRGHSLGTGPWALVALVAVWGSAALVGIASHFGDRTTESLWASYLRTQQLLEEARDQRLELKQVQEDLVHANAELARLSERLSHMYQVAEEARRAKEEFVANVSHELRTPLNMIIGFTEMISEAPHAYGTDLPHSLLADVDVILRNSRHLAGLVDDVLDLSQVEAGKMSLNRERSSLREIIEGALVAVRPLFEAKELDLLAEIPADLPPVLADRTRIRQVMLNLLSNAARFTDRGGVRVLVRMEGRELVVSVTDTGPGIAPEHQQRVFEPFQQVDGSIRRQFGGTGLGLSISKRFIEMHGGRVWLQSQLGAGSTFFFSLPMQEPGQVADDGRRWLAVDYYDKAPMRRSKAPRILPAPRYVVVEAGTVLRRLLSRYLEGAELVSFDSLDRALEELARTPAQALIVNDPTAEQLGSAVMPRKQLPYGTPTIACYVPGEEEAAARLGVARYLLKPVSLEGLTAALAGLGREVTTILLADDQPEVLQLLGRMLASTGKGYRVLKAYSGQLALNLLRDRRPDVMLLDLMMPGMDGFQVLAEKKDDPEIRDIPVIAVSAVDPARGSVIGNTVALARSGGLDFGDLLGCIRMWSESVGRTG